MVSCEFESAQKVEVNIIDTAPNEETQAYAHIRVTEKPFKGEKGICNVRNNIIDHLMIIMWLQKMAFTNKKIIMQKVNFQVGFKQFFSVIGYWQRDKLSYKW